MMLPAIRNSWEKNWPEIHAGLTGGLPRFILARRPGDVGSSVPVFCYHFLDAASFEEDLEFLVANRYRTIDATVLLGHLTGAQEAPPRSVVLSVDDGASNLLEVGFPLLRKYRATAVAFVAPRFHAEESTPRDDAGGYPLPCTWGQMREMHRSGHVDFQSHGLEHRYLPRWPEPIEMTGIDPEWILARRGPPLSIAEDLRLSKETLEEKLDKPIHHLAFVKYKGTDEALRIGAKCGYRAFWWGYLPRHPGNGPGQPASHVARIDGFYLRRLPGSGRLPLTRILRERYRTSLSRLWPVANSGASL